MRARNQFRLNIFPSIPSNFGKTFDGRLLKKFICAHTHTHTMNENETLPSQRFPCCYCYYQLHPYYCFISYVLKVNLVDVPIQKLR